MSVQHSFLEELLSLSQNTMKTVNISDTFSNFNRRLENINQHTSDEQKKRLHYRSLRNFIFHYTSFRKGRLKATELLEEYLTLLEAQDYSLTVEQSKAVYDLYIGPIAQNYYSRYLNFSSAFALFFEILLFGIPFYFSWQLFHSKTLNIFILTFYIIYWANYIGKYYRKKIYGYRY